MLKLPEVKTDFYALTGGMDLETPPIVVEPGKCLDAQNYEPLTTGGYGRINGHERFDGQASPTAASYWLLSATITGAVTVGATLTGATSAATGLVLGVFGAAIVLGRVTGTFVTAENLTISALAVAVSTSAALVNSASLPSDDADYRLLSANDWRTNILVVPGSGRIRGVWVYSDVVYAFRDNAGATAGAIYKATAGGWVLVGLGQEIQFTAAVGQINNADIITGGTSAATAVVVRTMLRTGSWTAAGAGTLIVATVIGTFVSGEPLKVSTVIKATSGSGVTNITRAPGGQVECINANFTGSTATLRMYGVDGVNLAWEFDGATYVPIRTGMVTDTPAHVGYHRGYLMLSFLGSVQLSGIFNPYAWTAILGAAELATGDAVTGFVQQTGNYTGSSMAIFCKTKTFILYGTNPANFNLVNSIYDMGYAAGTMVPVSNNTFGLTPRGIQSLITTLNYGDFNYDAISFSIQSYMATKAGLETVATTSKTRNQYRLYFNDNTGLVVGLTGEKVNGIMPLNYGKVVRCICTATLSSGKEAVYFGSDDGYIYQDNIGTSFDGAPIEAWVRPVFNNLKSPQLRKRFRRAIFEVKSLGYSLVNATYDLGYSTPNILPADIQPGISLTGAGGYWGQFTWDQFIWSAQTYSASKLSIEGTETNISFLFYSNRAQDNAHVITGISLMYTPRRIAR